MSRTIRGLLIVAAVVAMIAYMMLPGYREEICVETRDAGNGNWYGVIVGCDP